MGFPAWTGHGSKARGSGWVFDQEHPLGWAKQDHFGGVVSIAVLSNMNTPKNLSIQIAVHPDCGFSGNPSYPPKHDSQTVPKITSIRMPHRMDSHESRPPTRGGLYRRVAMESELTLHGVVGVKWF